MKRTFLTLLLSLFLCLLSLSQIRVRVLTGSNPKFIFFKVVSGTYTIFTYTPDSITLSEGEMAVLTLYNGKVAVRTRSARGMTADSVIVRAGGDGERFLLSTSDDPGIKRIYCGDLQCIPDLGALLLINICDVESYLTGVVKAEGGNGKKEEYFKTQAVIARTYTYRNYYKHKTDRFNLCDDTHCQVTNGINDDSLIVRAVKDTRDIVITTPDSNLIISAFHSNCGGETSPSEFAWLSKQDYLAGVVDPYCVNSRNATWVKVVAIKEWTDMLLRNGFKGITDSAGVLDFSGLQRVRDYTVGSFSLPFSIIRKELNLRSAWFRVTVVNDSVVLSGRGYGHGVGLCQEGAMVMAAKGSGYARIIDFYYPGVRLLRIGEAKKVEEDPLSKRN